MMGPLESARRKLNLPLPDGCTEEESAECLRMFRAALDRLRIDMKDTAGLDDVREYATAMHAKYGPMENS